MPVLLDYDAPVAKSSILGLEAQHRWNDQLTLNLVDRGTWPRYRLQRITGLHSRADMDEQRDPVTGSIGELAREAILRGKSVVYEGQIMARSLPQLREAVATMEAAFAETDEGTMLVFPHAPAAGPARQFVARVTQLEIVEEQGSPFNITMGYQRAFTLGLRMSDPRFFDPVESSAQLIYPVGGAVLPVALPSALALSNGMVVVARNDGNAPAVPVIELNGPAGPGFYVQHDEQERSLTFSGVPGLALRPGQQLIIDFATRAITLDGWPTPELYDAAASDWWDDGVYGLLAADNTIRYGEAQSGASGVVRWHDAYW